MCVCVCVCVCVVGVGNCFSGVPSASFLCQLEAVFSDFIDRYTKHVVLVDDASNIEQILAATPHKAPTIRSPASHQENYPG